MTIQSECEQKNSIETHQEVNKNQCPIDFTAYVIIEEEKG